MIALSKLQENVSTCPTHVPVAAPRKQGIRGFNKDDGDCQPLYIVGGLSAASPCSPIPFNTAENIIQAAAFAGSLGLPLGYHLTVRWTDDEGKDHVLFLRKIAEWQRYHIGLSVFVWAREAKNGPHSHILLYIPRRLANRFRKLARRWLKEGFGLRRLATGALSMTKIRSHGDPYEHIRHRVRYILKGADAETRLFLGCRKWESGFVKGKRAGVSQSLGEAARRKAGGVLSSGHRKATQEMLTAAMIRDQRREETRQQFGEFSEALKKG